MKLIIALVSFITILSCQTRDDQKSLAKGGLNSDYQDKDCKAFQPAPITDYWLKKAKLARIVPVIDNAEAWLYRWRMIQEARETIDIQYYILKKDPYVMAMIGLLRKKIVEDGVKVRLMIDTRGSAELARVVVGKDYLQELIKVGAEVRVFNPLIHSTGKVKFIVDQLNKSFGADSTQEFSQRILGNFLTAQATANHDKILLVDKRYSMFGGRNISTKYFLKTKDYKKATDDADIFIDSREIAKDIERAFLLEYNLSFNSTMKDDVVDIISRIDEIEKARIDMERTINRRSMGLRGFGQRAREPAAIPDDFQKFDPTGVSRTIDGFFKGHYRKPKLVAILDNTSILADLRCQSVTYIARKPENVQITTSVHYLMAHAKKEIWLMNQYFVPTPEFEQALDAAKARNIPVHLVTNNVVSDDVLFTQTMFQNEWPDYKRRYPNLHIHVTTKPAKLHTKMFVIDDEHTIITSYNIDPVSQNINSELAAYIKDRETAQDMLSYMKEFVAKDTIDFTIQNGQVKGMEQLYGKYPEAKETMEKYRDLYPRIKQFRSRF